MRGEDFLARLLEVKRGRVAASSATRPLAEVRASAMKTRANEIRPPHAFRAALEDASRVNIIAEFKRASPSKGEIRRGISALQMARLYCEGGAAAVSVLTEEDYFLGSLGDLAEVSLNVGLPVLRKDFIFDEYQVYEAAAAGADALLLIVAALDDATLARLLRLTEAELGMDALVEVHTAEEMRRAALAGATLIGVNNRDLRTFRVSLDVSHELAAQAPRGSLLVSESGIKEPADVRRLRAVGFRAFLVGETLMRAAHPGDALRALLRLD
jgi:indole-3-glycerol phosphate synthase